jgi:hypothetical protein
MCEVKPVEPAACKHSQSGVASFVRFFLCSAVQCVKSWDREISRDAGTRGRGATSMSEESICGSYLSSSVRLSVYSYPCCRTRTDLSLVDPVVRSSGESILRFIVAARNWLLSSLDSANCVLPTTHINILKEWLLQNVRTSYKMWCDVYFYLLHLLSLH